MTTFYTPEIIRLFSHPFIQGRRGEWQIGDELYSKDWGKGIVIAVLGSSTDVIDVKDKKVYFPRDNAIYHHFDIKDIWLPPAINDEQPERSLWGMVRRLYGIGHVTKEELYGCDYGEENGFKCVKGLTPAEALLRAIWAQKGEPK